MLPKSLLAGACLLLVGGAVIAWMRGSGDATPASPAAPRASERLAPAALAPEDPFTRTAAVAPAADASRAIPDDVDWIDVAVVDAATHLPVAGATVRWFDESSLRHASERHGLSRTEQSLLRDDSEGLAELGGWRTSTDATGRARIAVAGTATVLAEHGGDFGELLVRAHAAAPAAGHRIEIERDRVLRVQVLDAAGAPCGGVKVRITGSDDESRLALTREQDGIATFRHLQLLAPRPDAADAWTAFAVLLGDDSTKRVAFSIAEPPTEPLELRLPPCGSVCARAAFRGEQVAGVREITLWHQRGLVLDSTSEPVGADGCACFRYVPLDRELEAVAYWLGATKFAGPRAPDERVDVTVSPRDGDVVWTGRLVGADRSPLADQPLAVKLAGSQERPVERVARTDADGRFVVGLIGFHDGYPADRIWIDWKRTSGVAARAELAPRTLRSGVEDLGDVVATTPPLVVSGRITGVDVARRGVTLRAERLEPTSDCMLGVWVAANDVIAEQRSNGTFTIRGTTASRRHRLVVGGDVQPIEPIEFAVGGQDLSIELEAGHDLAAGVLLPDDVPPQLVVVELVPSSPVPMAPARRERLAAFPRPQHGERHDLQWTAIAAGTYTLELRPRAATTPVLRIADVRVPPPAGGDPRLADLDLRPLVRATTIQRVAADGEPLGPR